MKYRMLIPMFIFFALCIGCSGKVKVTGKVAFDDGTPLTTGTVYFVNEKTSAFGKLNDKGEYRMGMVKDGDGIPKGQYKIYFVGALKEDASLTQTSDDGGSYAPKVLIIDPKFTNAEKSGLTCDVQGSMKNDIKVSKPGPDYKPEFSKGDAGND